MSITEKKKEKKKKKAKKREYYRKKKAKKRMNENVISEIGPEREVHSKTILPFSDHNKQNIY